MAAPDEKTFVVKLAHPTFPTALYLATLWGTGPIPGEVDHVSPNPTEAENFVSSGPFKIKSWTHQAELVIEPNPNWYGDEADPDRDPVRRSVATPPRIRRRSRPVSWTCSRASPPDVPRITADPELGPLVVTQPTLIFDYWGFDTTKGPTANRAFRRAFDGDRQGDDDGDRLWRPGSRGRQR